MILRPGLALGSGQRTRARWVSVTMHIAVLQFTLLIRGATSIKDKRRVVKSLKDRLHREHLVSVAEVEHLDSMSAAGMAVCAVNRDAHYLQGLLDTIVAKLGQLTDAEVRNVSREIIAGGQLPASLTDDDGVPLWSEAERREIDSIAELDSGKIGPDPLSGNSLRGSL